MSPRALLPLLGVLVASACTFEFRPDTPLVGSYLISPGCTLVVDEDGASAACASSGKLVKVTIGDDDVTFERVVTTETETNTECWVERVCTRSYGGSAHRSGGKSDPYGGRFALLAGSWSGSLTLKVACSKQKAASPAPAWCNKGSAGLVYSFSATVSDHEAKITWSASNDTSGSFQAAETKDGVRVAEEFYRRIEGDAGVGGGE